MSHAGGIFVSVWFCVFLLLAVVFFSWDFSLYLFFFLFWLANSALDLSLPLFLLGARTIQQRVSLSLSIYRSCYGFYTVNIFNKLYNIITSTDWTKLLQYLIKKTDKTLQNIVQLFDVVFSLDFSTRTEALTSWGFSKFGKMHNNLQLRKINSIEKNKHEHAMDK